MLPQKISILVLKNKTLKSIYMHIRILIYSPDKAFTPPPNQCRKLLNSSNCDVFSSSTNMTRFIIPIKPDALEQSGASFYVSEVLSDDADAQAVEGMVEGKAMKGEITIFYK